MPLWLIFLLLGLIKLPIAVLMIWIPLRSDDAMSAIQDAAGSQGDDEGDGGSGVRPVLPADPHPRPPLSGRRRRGPHGLCPASPARVRRPRGLETGRRLSPSQRLRLR
jgi:hypothetical protein